MATILSVSRSLPSHDYPQSRFTSEISKLFPRDSYDPKRLSKFHQSVSVAHRQLALPITEVASWGYESFTERNDAFIKFGLEMIERCSRSALYKAGIKANDVDHIFYVSSTGCSNPSMDIRLLNRFHEEYDPDTALGPDVGSFRRHVSRTSIFGVGCAGGGTLLNRVSDYLSGHPNKVALAISCEPFSLMTQYWDTSLANLIGTGLFGDAAAAIVLAGDGFVQKKKALERKTMSYNGFVLPSNGINGVSHANGFHHLDSNGLGDVVSPALYSPTAEGNHMFSSPRSSFSSPSHPPTPKPKSAPLRPRVITGRSYFHRDTEDKIGWEIGSFGFKLVLAKDVGTIIKANILKDANEFLSDARDEAIEDAQANCKPSGLGSRMMEKAEGMPETVDDIASFVVHPGGPALLDKVSECFSIIPSSSVPRASSKVDVVPTPSVSMDENPMPPLPKTQQALKGMELSWKSLEDVGNCSSVSVMMILEDTIKTTMPGTTIKSSLNLKEGDYSLLIGFGPGFCVEMTLMEWVSA